MTIATARDLALELERRIAGGELGAGSRLSPIRQAAKEWGLAPNTVASAYRALGDKGLVVSEGRRGTFVAEPYQLVGGLVPEIPSGVKDLASGRPDPGLLPDLGPFLAGLGGSEVTYGDPPVDPGFEAASRRILEAESVPAGRVAVTGGAVDAIERVLGAWLRPGAGVGVEDPGWFAIVDLVKAMGMVPVPVATDPEGISPESLGSELGRIGALVVTPRAQNPTGVATSPRRAGELAGVLDAKPELLVLENDHMGPVAGVPLAPLGPGRERWAFVRSFSKALGPDLRIAVMTGDSATMERVMRRQLVGPGWVSHILQRTVAALLAAPEVGAGQERATAAYRRRRELVAGSLGGRGLGTIGNSGLNLWVPVPDEEVAVRAALDRGLAVRAGRRFRHRAGPGVRVTISEVGEEDALELGEALAGRPLSSSTRAV